MSNSIDAKGLHPTRELLGDDELVQASSALYRRRYNIASTLEVAAFIPDKEAAVPRVWLKIGCFPESDSFTKIF